jgi:enoyl-CoA hydratase/carnithine racemase
VEDAVLYERRDRLAFVTLNRPHVKNAIDPAMHEELCDIWSDFDADETVDVAIVTGAGDAFCAGADLRSYVPVNYVNATPARVREIVDLGFAGLTRGLHRIRKPVIAAINGWALAGGLELSRLRATCASPQSGRCSAPSRPAAVSIMAMAASRGW